MRGVRCWRMRTAAGGVWRICAGGRHRTPSEQDEQAVTPANASVLAATAAKAGRRFSLRAALRHAALGSTRVLKLNKRLEGNQSRTGAALANIKRISRGWLFPGARFLVTHAANKAQHLRRQPFSGRDVAVLRGAGDMASALFFAASFAFSAFASYSCRHSAGVFVGVAAPI